MFSSTIIPTVGRDTLERAVCSVLEQDLQDDFEVIVVNDSGERLAPEEWQRSDRVKILHTQQHERSVARNTGAGVARGEYLHFLDDDDWLLPGALQTLWKLSAAKPSKFLYGSTQLVDRDDAPIIQLHHELDGNCFVQVMAGEWIPIGAFMVNKEVFFSIGGFNSLLTGSEDIDLVRRIALKWDLAYTDPVVVCVRMGMQGSTTDYDLLPIFGRSARELIIDQAGAWRRLHRSATSSFWKGRILRIYLTSMVWNITHKRLFTSLSRAGHSFACVFASGKSLLSGQYWNAVLNAYDSLVFQRGFQETAGDRSYSDSCWS